MANAIKKYSWMIGSIAQAPWATKKDVVSAFLTAKKKYMPDKKTNADVDALLKCALCPNMCRFDCPVLSAEKTESVAPSAKSRLAYLLEMGHIPWSDDAVNVMYACTMCDACQHWCPFDFSVGDLLVGVRHDVVEHGMAPPALMRYREKIAKTHTVYDEGVTSLAAKREKGADVLYFPGCTTLNKTPEIAKANEALFEKERARFTSLEEQWCCGAPLHMLGFEEEFRTFALHNANEIKKSGCTTLVCDCPECAYTFRELYPSAGIKLNVEVLHTSAYFLNALKKGVIKPGALDASYVYHDPCVLARRLDDSETPRALLGHIPKLEIKEAQFNRKETKCCGFGGMLGVTRPATAAGIAEKRLVELASVSKNIVTACPTCKLAFERANKNKDLTIKDVSELIVESLRS